MNFSTLREGNLNCPSDLSLDRLHAGEAVPAVKAHVDGCDACGLRMKARTAGFDAVEGVDPRAMLAKIRTRLDAPPKSSIFARLWAPLGAVAALALIFMVLPHAPVDEGTRLKGGLALHVFRLAAENQQGKEALSGDRFHPGDRLRFLVDLPRASRVRVYGQEATGALYVAWPLETSSPDSFAAGDRRELPGAVALDASEGQETLVLISCTASEPACTSSGTDKLDCAKDCAQVRFVMRKGP